MVISGVNTVTYNGDGSQTAWPFTFPIASASEIKVQLINADGTTTAVENDYYVDVVNNTVYYPGYAPGSEPPEADQPPKVQTGQKIEIYREVPMTQEANLGDAWPYYIIEKGLDKLTMIAQQIYSYTNRKLDSALASMFQLAGIVTDSGKLQHITDQYNAIDANAAAAAAKATAAANSATAAATSATNAANSDASATATAAALTNFLETKETLTAPAVDPTLTISDAAADAKVAGDAINELKSAISETQDLLFYINSNMWVETSYVMSILISVDGGEELSITAGNQDCHYAGLTTDSGVVDSGTPAFSATSGWTGVRTLGANFTTDVKIPSDVKFLYVFLGSGGARKPASIIINGIDFVKSIFDNLLEINSVIDIHGNSLEDVTKNFEEIKKINGNAIKPSDFELGNITINTGGWTYNDSDYRLRTKEGTVIKLTKGDVISLDDYSKARFYFGCRADNVYTKYGWLSSDFIVPITGEYVVLVDAVPASIQSDKFTLLNRLNVTCSSNSINSAINWNNTVRAINHRGYNTIAPENTLPAFKLSKKYGFEYVECDVQLTSDRVPVIIHDSTINRTARNADGTSLTNTINISDITYDQAAAYDFGIWKGLEYAGTKIPTFTEFIILCRNLGLMPYIEIKESVDFTEAEIKNLCDIVRSVGMTNKVSWISSNLTFLTYIRDYVPSARLGYVKTTMYSSYLTEVLTLKTATNEIFLDINNVTDELLSGIIINNVPVEYWTINSVSDILALNEYVTGVTSDSLIAGKVLYERHIKS